MKNRQSLQAPPLHDLRVSDDLDLLRGLAAIIVLIYHIRYRFFFDYGDLVDPGWLTNIFYAVTSLGHDAVIIFFVLSGYFIGSSVIRDVALARWSWARYALSRLTRLYIVLIPGVVLTLCWDGLGLSLFSNHAVYSGAKEAWWNDFFPVAERLQPITVIGNLGFLQMILVPPLGSNEALWSLSYEFWYYVMFPLAYLAWYRRSPRSLIYLAIFGLVLWFVGSAIAFYSLIWLGFVNKQDLQIGAIGLHWPA